MADALTKSQSELDKLLIETTDQQRTFDANYGDALYTLRRKIVHQATIVTAAGLVLGGLVGAIVGMGRR
ncbi:hypothetical protein SAMN02745121_07006 [Nannocystis exedens]|uniref:Uncharacterized protein n=1 Tax=Nannocystis exedens TaxID=54 RepID=A0A1I2G2C7_9BACT|nr:hypothetical protein [Nannocystis exedens]SFF11289.1 hypothetical protein SAMN02745121_07006 [Nannocystis exedens]